MKAIKKSIEKIILCVLASMMVIVMTGICIERTI